jgi:YfiH family protein
MIPLCHVELLTHSRLSHGFFTREGGVSVGHYASLNTGYGSGDDLACVGENRRRITASLGAETADVMTCHQIHSNIVHVITEMPFEKLEGDALVTNRPGLAIGVLTADCVPVLFADVEAGVIGAAHAGWRGAEKGILQATIAAMESLGAMREAIVVAIGPCIQQASYEVGGDVYQVFTSKQPDFKQFFKSGSDGAHFWFDVGGVTEHILRLSGVANIERLGYDTYAEEKRFFSFRRSTHRSEPVYGRQMSAILLKE